VFIPNRRHDGGHVTQMGEIRNTHTVLVRIILENGNLEHPYEDGRVILKWILKK